MMHIFKYTKIKEIKKEIKIMKNKKMIRWRKKKSWKNIEKNLCGNFVDVDHQKIWIVMMKKINYKIIKY